MDFIFIKSSKAGKEDYGSIYARVRSGKANMKVVTGFTIKQLEWEKYRSLQYTSSALMSSIGIKYGQFAQVLARIKAAFEADGFNPKEAKNIIESVKHDVLNGMMQIVEVKPKGRMLFEDFLTSYIEDMETGRRTKKGRTVKVSPAYIKGLRIIQKQIRNYQKETHRKLGLDDMTMETRNSLVGYWKERGLMPNAINSYMTDVRTVAKAAYEDKLTKCDDFRHSDFVPKKEEVDNIYLTPEQIQVVVHPQSVIHSMVQFEDGAVIAQLGIPDMKLPISYAFSYPKRLHSKAPRLDFTQYATLTFEEPDMERFRNLAFAFDAVRKGGNMPCILNAANEVVVAAFLRDEIGFLQMSDVIEKTMAKATFISVPTYEDYVATDAEARKIAEQFFN